jgi:FADH2 O2-dependent halogenase
MIRAHADVVILGAGFAGSLLAAVLRRVGRSVVLVERGSHPRFAIGESSTPLANLALEELSRRYDLPWLFPLSEWGRWQAAYPDLACGLKRGFTFVRHEAGQEYRPRADHANELLVAASPADEVADTHWFREHVDHFMLRQAQRAGASYHDRTEVSAIEHGRGWRLTGRRGEEPVEVTAEFLVDASGPGCPLARALGIATSPGQLRTNSWSVYSHFEGVGLWHDVLVEQGGRVEDHPYRCDDAALHHVFDDGWMWVLRFNNGVTSAGFVLDGARRQPDESLSPEGQWQAILVRHPSIARQFRTARPVRPWVRTGRLQRGARRCAGPDWAMLAHAAYFLDPLFSPGNAHTLLSIERLGHLVERYWGQPALAEEMARYESALQREVAFLDRIVHGCFQSFRAFDLLCAYSMYYFAGAIHSERCRRQGASGPWDEFLFSHHPPFRAAVYQRYEGLLELARGDVGAGDAAEFGRQVAEDIAPYNVAGLCDPGKRNMYPFVG